MPFRDALFAHERAGAIIGALVALALGPPAIRRPASVSARVNEPRFRGAHVDAHVRGGWFSPANASHNLGASVR